MSGTEHRFGEPCGDPEHDGMSLQEAISHSSGGEVVVKDLELEIATIDISLKAQEKVRSIIHRYFPSGGSVTDDNMERWGAELMALWLDKRLERLAKKEGKQS